MTICKQNNMRYERKFRLDAESLHSFYFWLKKSGTRYGFKRAYEDRSINNLYFESKNFTAFDEKMEFVKDYNLTGPTNVRPYRGAEDSWDLKGHHEMYMFHNMAIGEWYQNIYNAQQICKANNFSFAWTTSTLSFHEMSINSFDDEEFRNVLDLDVRFDRNVVKLDKTFVSLHFKHLQLAILNGHDRGTIMDGTQHFTKHTQKMFAGYLANLLLKHEDWWWSK